MQNGGLSHILSSQGMGGLAGMPGSLGGALGGPGGLGRGSQMPPYGQGMPLQGAQIGLQNKQISNLWMNSNPNMNQFRKEAQELEEEVAAEDEDDMGVMETYSNYMPSKLKVRTMRLRSLESRKL